MAAAWKHFKEGGWGMYVILFWSIIEVGVIVERALYLYGSSINKDVFLATMQKCILAGDIAKAVKMCSAANAPLARIVQAGLVKVNRPDEEVQAAMDESALREIPRIAKRTGYLALLAHLIPRSIARVAPPVKASPAPRRSSSRPFPGSAARSSISPRTLRSRPMATFMSATATEARAL